MKKKAIIISIKGIKLSKKEKLLLSKEKPWGLILFKRNIKSFYQVKNLVSDIKKLSKNQKFPILIDEEGLSVSRLRNIFNHKFDASYFGNLYKIDQKVAQQDLEASTVMVSQAVTNKEKLDATQAIRKAKARLQAATFAD